MCSVIKADLAARTLFMLSQDVVQDVQELMDMELLEDQRGTETDGLFSTGTHKQTWWENTASHKATASYVEDQV